jgi:hypothetical protein
MTVLCLPCRNPSIRLDAAREMIRGIDAEESYRMFPVASKNEYRLSSSRHVREWHVPQPWPQQMRETGAVGRFGEWTVSGEYVTLNSLKTSHSGDLPGPKLGSMVGVMSSCNIAVFSSAKKLKPGSILSAHKLHFGIGAGTCSRKGKTGHSTRVRIGHFQVLVHHYVSHTIVPCTQFISPVIDHNGWRTRWIPARV